MRASHSRRARLCRGGANPLKVALRHPMGVFRPATLILMLVFTSISLDTFASPQDSKPYAALVDRAGEVLGVSPTVVHAVIAAESSYDPSARSHAGALGLMQLIPETGALEAYRYLYGRNEIPTDASLLRPEVNVWLGTAYLRVLGERYFGWVGNPDVRVRAILAAYNWGPTRVLSRLLPERNPIGLDEFMDRLYAEAPKETQEYLRRVLTRAVAQAGPVLALR